MCSGVGSGEMSVRTQQGDGRVHRAGTRARLEEGARSLLPSSAQPRQAGLLPRLVLRAQ